MRIGTLCNDALLTCEHDFCNIFGDPTEGALVVAAAKAGMDKEVPPLMAAYETEEAEDFIR